MAKCPYCKHEITLENTKKQDVEEIHKEVEGVLKKEVMYVCPHCDCVLGFSFYLGGLLTHRS